MSTAGIWLNIVVVYTGIFVNLSYIHLIVCMYIKCECRKAKCLRNALRNDDVPCSIPLRDILAEIILAHFLVDPRLVINLNEWKLCRRQIREIIPMIERSSLLTHYMTLFLPTDYLKRTRVCGIFSLIQG